MKAKDFDNFAGLLSILAAVSGFAYAVSFIIISRSTPEWGALLSALFLLLSGFLATGVWTALSVRMRQVSESFGLWGYVLGLAAAVGMAIHGGYDLANALNPPAENLPALANLPSQIDPRGLLTFGVGGVALLLASWLLEKDRSFPKNLVYLGGLSGALSLVLYFSRLIVLEPANPLILYPALINGFVANPLWYLWLGLLLRRR